MYGDPSEPHEVSIDWFIEEVKIELYKQGRDAARRAISGTGSTTRDLPEAKKEPDFSFKPKNSPDNPTIIGEIAYENESFVELIRESELWRTSIETQFFIGVKINNRTRGSKRNPNLKAIIWQKTPYKYYEINFGKGSSNEKNKRLYIEIPLDCLFHGAQKPSSLQGINHIKLDLYELWQDITSTL